MFPKANVYLFLFLLGNSLLGESEVNYGYLKENESIQIKAGEILSIVGFSGVNDQSHALMLTLDDESDVFFPVSALGNQTAVAVLDPSGEVSTRELADLATEAAVRKGMLKTRFERLQEVSGEVSFVRFENGRITGRYTEKQMRKSVGESNLNSQRIVGPCVLKNRMSYLSYKLITPSKSLSK